MSENFRLDKIGLINRKETMNKKTKPIKTLNNKSRKGRFV